MDLPEKIKAIDLPKPHGFLVWKGKQTCLIDKEILPDSELIAIVSDNEVYGLAQLENAVGVDEEFLKEDNTHRLKSYEIPDGQLYAHNIKQFNALEKPLPAHIEDGLLVLEELPEVSKKGKQLLEQAKELPNSIIAQSDYIAISEDGKVVSQYPIEGILNILNRNFDTEFTQVDSLGDSLALGLYDLTLTRVPNMRFKQMSPPNLRMADSESLACKMCENWNNGTCELYKQITDANQVCDSFDPRYEGTAIMLPIPIEVGQYLMLREQDVPMGSKLTLPEDMHITLYYEKGINPLNLLDMPQLLEYIGEEIQPPVVNINGIAKFEKVEDGQYDALVVGVTSPEIEKVHNWICSYTGKDFEVERFTPYITLAYVPTGSQIPNVNYNRETFNIPSIALHAGGTRMFETKFRGLPYAAIEMEAKQEMPYEKVEIDGQYCVRKIGEDKPIECYDKEGEADDYLAALRINVEAEEGKQWDGSASNYDDTNAYCDACLIDLNSATGQEEKVQKYCMLPVKKNGSDTIDPEGLKAAAGGRGIGRLTKPDGVSQADYDKAVKAAANKIISEYPDLLDRNAPPNVYEIAGKTPPEKAKEGRRIKTEWLKKLSDFGDFIQDMLSWARSEDDKMLAGFGIKEVDGEPIFYTFSTNAFEDRDGEIIETSALEEYVIRNMENESKGYFNYWHVPGTDFAEKRWQGVVGRILVEAGPFLKNKKGRSALKFFKKYQKSHPIFAPEGWGASIEFKYLPEQRPTGVYKWLHITRTSVLPLSRAANINTKGELKMALTDEVKQLGIEVFGGEANFEEIEKFAEGLTKQLEKTTRYKEVENEDTEVASKNVEEEEIEQENVTENSEQEEVTESTPDTEAEAKVEQVEQESVETEVVEEAEVPQTVDVENVVEQVAERVSEGLKEDLDVIKQVISTFPDALQQLGNRIGQLENKAKVEKAVKTRSWGLFESSFANSITQVEGDEKGKEASKEDIEKAKPPETKANEKGDGYGGAFFNH